ncbi:MAG: hypothetical protein KJN93_04875, partial [Alphaproteobacteria bacterium]|nr:hypothetical protein [Alphaproteobacteria bacterium]
VEAVSALAGHQMAETDPEIGANLMFFFVRDWSDLEQTPHLDRLIPDLAALLTRLRAADANQYRIFRFDTAGAIMACFVFLRMDGNLAAVPAEALALGQVVQSMLLWSDTAFSDVSPMARIKDGRVVLRAEIAELLRAAYDPILPAVADDASYALRLHARMGDLQ